MQVVCAWCNKTISEKAEHREVSDFAISHGICKSCKEYFLSNEEITLDGFLNRLEAPVMMINSQGEVVLANTKLLDLLGKDLDGVKGFQGGDVMECAYARLPEGCGNTVHCAACTIRNNVMDTFETGRSKKKVPAFLNRQDRDTVHTVRFLVSTEKMGDIVLLKIDIIDQ